MRDVVNFDCRIVLDLMFVLHNFLLERTRLIELKKLLPIAVSSVRLCTNSFN